MSLRIVDVSSWQEGIDLAALDCDGAVVKATQGTGYVNPDCARAVEQALAAGKAVGVYHYVSGSTSPEAEADFFVDQITGWLGRVVLVLDWEENENWAWGNEDWLRRMAQRVIDRTGTRPIIYASAAVFPWGLCESLDLGAWIAQYADMEPRGWEDDPWRSFSGGTMHQYTSNGRLAGWSGGLDLNLFYGDRAAWDAYAGGSVTPPAAATAPDGAPLLAVDRDWGPLSAARIRAVMGLPPEAPWTDVVKALQVWLSWRMDAYDIWAATDGQGDRIEVDGSDGPIFYACLRDTWNRSRVPEGRRIPAHGLWDEDVCEALQIWLNHSSVGTRALGCRG